MPVVKTENSRLKRSPISLLQYISVFVAVVASQISFAQSTDQTTYVEETIVTAQLSLSAQKTQLETAQEGIFDLFNEIYADTDYEMICEREKQVLDGFNPTAGSWAVRTCRSSFIRELRAEAAEDYVESGFVDEVEYERSLAQHKEENANIIRELYDTNPQFREQFTNYVTMRNRYEEALEADAAKGNFFTNLFRSRSDD